MMYTVKMFSNQSLNLQFCVTMRQNFQSIRGRVLQTSRLPPDLQRVIVERLTLNLIENGGIVPDAVIAYVNGILQPQF